MAPGKVTIFIMWTHPDGWKRDKDLVNSFYNEKEKSPPSPSVKPNKAPKYYALAELDKYFEFNIVTQKHFSIFIKEQVQKFVIQMHGKSAFLFSVKKDREHTLEWKKIFYINDFLLS